jgi:hypothetical protein
MFTILETRYAIFFFFPDDQTDEERIAGHREHRQQKRTRLGAYL